MKYERLMAALGVEGKQTHDTRDGHLEMRALCPLHRETGPSFSINLQTGHWFCQAQCGGGSFPELVMRVQGVTWMEALSWIRSEGRSQPASVLLDELQQRLATPEPPETVPEEDVTAAWQYYESLSFNMVPVSMLRRGFTAAMLARWGTRYDPAREMLVIPVSKKHEFVGFVARQMRPDAQPRFLNSNFSRASVLFGLDRLSSPMPMILLVEGPLKAMWAQHAGLPAVATFGDQVSPEQLQEARACAKEVVLGLDSDEAGRLATQRLGPQLSPYNVSVLEYPEGRKDADECTFAELQECWTRRKPFLTWRLTNGRNSADPSAAGSVEERREDQRRRQ